MKLIHVQRMTLVEFVGDEIPPYAILSHTWGNREVTYKDFYTSQRRVREEDKKDFSKIEKACRQANLDDLKYIWIDTCCIDKSSSAELTEAINSMFTYYQRASKCYVYLEDVYCSQKIEQSLKKCRWVTRGWTLQELIAPEEVNFFDCNWQPIGTKRSLATALSDITRIPTGALVLSSTFKSYSVAVRMSWAATRSTTRVEDAAYSLLGIFDVNMPLLYGEGRKAFRRLQEEIIRRSGDLTILAWQGRRASAYYQYRLAPLLASSASDFADTPISGHAYHHGLNFSVTNNGLLIAGTIGLHTAHSLTWGGFKFPVYALTLDRPQPVASQAIALRKIGPKLYARDDRFSTEEVASAVARVADSGQFVYVTDIYVVIDPIQAHSRTLFDFRNWSSGALRIRDNEIVEVLEAIPHSMWDVTDRTFLGFSAFHHGYVDLVFALKFAVKIQGIQQVFVLFIRRSEDSPARHKFYLSPWETYRSADIFVSRQAVPEKVRLWTKLLAHQPAIGELNASFTCNVDDGSYMVSCEESSKEMLSIDSMTTSVRDLNISVTAIKD